MKFGRFLRSHTIPEWNRAYINYGLLKKSIGKAELELEELDLISKEDEESNLDNSTATIERTESPTNILDEEEEDGDDEGIKEDEVRTRKVNKPMKKDSFNVRLAGGTSTHSSGTEQSDVPTTITSTSTNLKEPLVIKTNFTPSINSPSTLPFQKLRAFSMSRRGSMNLISSPKPTNGDFYFTKAGDFNPKKFRTDFSNNSIQELKESLPPQCKKFFALLEQELDRVTDFYGKREEEAIKRFDELSLNWKQLAAHKLAYKAAQAGTAKPIPTTKPNESNPSQPLSSNNSSGADLRRRFDHSRTQIDASIASSSKAFQSSSISKTVSGILLPHTKTEEYTASKAKLKLATFEYYRSLTLLKSYKVLNRTGFAKALKKFEKSTRISCSKLYTSKLDQMNFVASTKLDELISRTEDVFTTTFEHGNRKKALGRLRMEGDEKTHHFAVWRSGMYLGIGLPLLIIGLVESGRMHTEVEIPYFTALLQLFGAMFLPILFTLLFFFNLSAWHDARVNYVLIFELDVRTRMDYHQFLEIPSFLFFIFSICFWASFSNFWPTKIEPSAYPAVFFIIALLTLLNPLPILNPSARWWMVRSFCRVISAGLVKVEFRDFYIADELNSLAYCMYNLGFIVCTYNHGWTDDIQKVCSTNETWTSPVLAALPAFWRLGQSIRRYLDSDGLVIHALNAGKYTASIAYYFVYFAWRINRSERNWIFVFWIVVAIINSVYTSIWDIFMDWNLGRKNSRHYMLRPELVFTNHWLYYVSIVVDIILRFSWVLYLNGSPNLSIQLRGYILAVLEVFRRIMWNAYRVESEHVGNVDGYRVTRDIALPYLPKARVIENSEDQDDIDLEPTSKKSKFFNFFHTLHKDIQDELSPITSISLPRMGYNKNNNKNESKGNGKRRASLGAEGQRVTTGHESSTPASESDGEIDSVTDVEIKGGRSLERFPTMEEMSKKKSPMNI